MKAAGAHEVMVYSRRGCHLCEAVEAEIRSMEVAGGWLKVVDIDEDPTLHGMYFLRIPVVSVGGREVFEAKMMDNGGEWRSRLAELIMRASSS